MGELINKGETSNCKLCNTVNGMTTMSLPNNFDEICICLYADAATSYTIHIPKLDLIATLKSYRVGRCLNVNNVYYLTQVELKFLLQQ